MIYRSTLSDDHQRFYHSEHKPGQIKKIVQRHSSGCAVACIAMLASVTYEDAAKKALGNDVFKRYRVDLSLSTTQILQGLRNLGLKAYPSRKKTLPNQNAILVTVNDDMESLHCVVWVPSPNEMIIDPAYHEQEPTSYYVSRWIRADYETYVVTGKR